MSHTLFSFSFSFPPMSSFISPFSFTCCNNFININQALAKSGRQRNEYFIFTKISPDNLVTPQSIETALANSLARLNTPYVDLYQIHWPNHDIDIKPVLQVYLFQIMIVIFNCLLQTLDNFKKLGRIKAIGVSNFGILYSSFIFILLISIPVIFSNFSLVLAFFEFSRLFF